MNKNVKVAIWAVAIGFGGYYIWKWAKKMHVDPREKAILDIESSKYSNFEDAFLQAWAMAKKQNQAEFLYQGKIYLSSNGRAKR